jgi:hypothetical protein
MGTSVVAGESEANQASEKWKHWSLETNQVERRLSEGWG